MATNSPASTARNNNEQQVGYLRITVNFNDANVVNGVGKQWLPAGAVLVGTDILIVTVFNAVTTNVLTCGTNGPSTYDNIANAGSNTPGTLGLTQNIKPSGTAAVPLAADSQVFVKFTQTGGAATTGQAIVVIKFITANDI